MVFRADAWRTVLGATRRCPWARSFFFLFFLIVRCLRDQRGFTAEESVSVTPVTLTLVVTDVLVL